MIELRNLSHGFLRKSLFRDVNVRLLPKERYGVVGANGSGKSTLLKIITKEVEPDNGEVDLPLGVSLFRIGQDHNLSDQELIIDTAMMGEGKVFDALKQKDALLLKKAQDQSDHDLPDKLAELEEIISTNDGYRLRSRSQSILEGLGIVTKDHEKPLKVLSGGYKWRVFLAQALIKNPDILLLDEPTNHLDIISIRCF